MISEKGKAISEKFHFAEMLQALDSDLTALDGVERAEYDLDGFNSGIPYVILLVKRDIPVAAENYFEQRRMVLTAILKAISANGLVRTEDMLEDYGEWWYIVTKLKEKS